MERPSAGSRRSPWLVFTLVLTLLEKATSLQTFVCSSSMASMPLECTNKQWVRIVAETYAPETAFNGTTCQQNVSSCNSYLHDTGMLVNCNGPAWPDGVACKEMVDVGTARRVTGCLQNVQRVSTLVQYDCIEGSTVLDLCEANATLTSGSTFYLASPGYPQTTAGGKRCSCSLKGSRMMMNAVDISVRSKLPWAEDSSSSDIDGSVFSVTSGSTVLWRSNDCAACTTTSLVNTNLFLSDESASYQDVLVTYSDFGLPGQNAWVEVFKFGPSLHIQCSSSPLPPDKLVTTPATPTPTSSTPAATATTMVITSHITTPPRQPAGTSTAHDVFSTPTGEMVTTYIPSGKAGSDSVSPVVLVVTLTLLLLLMAGAAALLGVVIYRKRHNFKSEDYINPCTLLQSWCHRLICQEQLRHSPEDSSVHHNKHFDAVALQDQPPCQHHSTSTPDGDHAVKQSGVVYAVNPDKQFHEGKRSLQHPAGSSVSHDGSLIPPELYQSHQEMLDKELVKMRQEKSSKPNMMTSEFNKLCSGRNTAEAETTLGGTCNVGSEGLKGNHDVGNESLKRNHDVGNDGLKGNHERADDNGDSRIENDKEMSVKNISNKYMLTTDDDIDDTCECDTLTVDQISPSFTTHELKHSSATETECVDRHRGLTHGPVEDEGILSPGDEPMFGVLGVSRDPQTSPDHNRHKNDENIYAIVDFGEKKKHVKLKAGMNDNTEKEFPLRREDSEFSHGSNVASSSHDNDLSTMKNTFKPATDSHITEELPQNIPIISNGDSTGVAKTKLRTITDNASGKESSNC